jgi:hypothetical protein
MSFYKEIVPFIEYIHSIRRLKNYMSFDMLFPTKWTISKSIIDEGEIVSFQAEDQNYKGISFVAQIDESNISLVLTKIARIIKLNKERELKEKLFKQTVEQLKQTFEKTDLDKLQNLYFDFDEEPELDADDEQDGFQPEDAELVGE